MKILVFLMLVSYAVAASLLVPLTTLIRTPADDTAVVESSRIGGNFVYSSIEGHAYKGITPIFGHIVDPNYLQTTNLIYVRN